MTALDLMLAGEPYHPSDSDLSAARERARSHLRLFNQEADRSSRATILGQLLGEYPAGLQIEPPFFCDYGSNIRFGENVFVNFNCVFLDCNRIEIGPNVLIGPAVQLYTAAHPLHPQERLSGYESAHAITIGANVWIAGGVIVCPGVSIGENSTIGAGSVVTKSIPANVVAFGNPCRVRRSI